jgi:hypothetical protein
MYFNALCNILDSDQVLRADNNLFFQQTYALLPKWQQFVQLVE